MKNYTINLGYDSLVAEFHYNSPEIPTDKVYSIPGWDSGDYLHEGIKYILGSEFKNTIDKVPHRHKVNLFQFTKNQAEEYFDIKVPFILKEEDDSWKSTKDNKPKLRIGTQDFIERSIDINLSFDFRSFQRWKNVNINTNTVDYFLGNDIEFIYPYQVYNSQFYSVPIPLPPQKVIDAAQKGKCKICFFYGIEGHIPNTYEKGIKPFAEFANKINTRVYLYHSNLKLSKKPHSLVIAPEYPYFEFDPWIVNIDRSNKENIISYNNQYFVKEQEHKLVKECLHKDNIKRFLIFNRRPRLHRTLLHSYIASHNTLKDQTYISLGKDPFIKKTIDILGRSHNPIGGKRRMREFIENNIEKYEKDGFELDANLDINQANNMPYSFFYNSLISVVTETETSKYSVFLTEKIFKPIVGLHPFIVFGNPYTLHKLREFGYKTFSNYWDESYDEEEVLYKRFNKIVNIIEELSVLPLEELKSMYFSMKDILAHNHSTLVSNNRVIKFLEELNTYYPSKPQLI